MKKAALSLLSVATVLSAGAGILLSAPVRKAMAATPASPGRVEIQCEDFFGNTVTIPVQYDGSKYILADYLRNIYTYDGTTLKDGVLPNGYNTVPMYTSTTGKFDDKMAVSIYYNVQKSYEFYTKANVGQNWKGLKGKDDDISDNCLLMGSNQYNQRKEEAPILIYAHMNADRMYSNASLVYTEYGDSHVGFMKVGDGGADPTGTILHNQGSALDVIGHEFQHGVSLSMNRGLGTKGQAGALNEAVSDIFGMLIERKDMNTDEFWEIGENAQDVGCIRSAKDTKIAKVSDRIEGADVHENATIFTHSQYSIWQLMPEFFDYEHTGQLWFKMLDYITKENQSKIEDDNGFTVFARCMQQAAEYLKFPDEVQEAITYALHENDFILEGIDPEDNMYIVTFEDENGNQLSRSYVLEGEKATAPVIEDYISGDYKYIFEGWNADFSKVTSDMTVRANVKKQIRPKVEYRDYEGNVLASQYADEGTMKEPEIPYRESTKEYEYKFLEWEQSTDADGNITYTAKFDEKRRGYSITTYEDGQSNQQTMYYGDTLPDPPKGKTWFLDPDFNNPLNAQTVTGNMTLFAGRASGEVNVGMIIGIIAGVVVIAGGAVLAVVLVKKKKNPKGE